jgi:hypothetical protein
MNIYTKLIGTLTRAQLNSFLASIKSTARIQDLNQGAGGLIYYGDRVGPFLVVKLNSGCFRVEFEETQNHFLYIWSENETQFNDRILKGVHFVARDLKKNPKRANKISLIIKA